MEAVVGETEGGLAINSKDCNATASRDTFLVKLFLVKLKHCNATFLRSRF